MWIKIAMFNIATGAASRTVAMMNVANFTDIPHLAAGQIARD